MRKSIYWKWCGLGERRFLFGLACFSSHRARNMLSRYRMGNISVRVNTSKWKCVNNDLRINEEMEKEYK